MKKISTGSLLTVAFLLLVIIAGLFYIRKPQDNRNRAGFAGASLSLNPATAAKPSGSEFTVGIILNAGTFNVTGAQIQLIYDSSRIQVSGFTPGTPLPLVLTQPKYDPSEFTVTLGAQPNQYMRGTDVIGTVKVKTLTAGPSEVNFGESILITAIENESNIYNTGTGLKINPAVATVTGTSNCLNAREGAPCTDTCASACPPDSTRACTMQCVTRTGVCRAGRCDTWGTAQTCGGITGRLCPTGYVCQYAGGSTRAPYPDASGTCVRASKCTPLPPCAYNTDPAAATCKIAAVPPEGGVWCPRLSTTPTPTPITATCINNKPTVVMTPSTQNGKPGTTLQYKVTVTNNDTDACTPSAFVFNGLVSAGWTHDMSNIIVSNIYPRQGATVNFNVTSASTNVTSNSSAPVTATVTNRNSGQNASATAAYVVVPQSTVQNLEFRVKLAGVSDASANGAKIAVKFVKNDGTTLQLSSILTLSHVADGVYKATATLDKPFDAGTLYRVTIKGEKHTAVKFCKQTGQSGPCLDADFIRMPSPVPTSVAYDFTGLALPPGDVTPQDGKVNATDFTAITSLMSKLCSALTAADKLKGDLDYSGCVNVRDVFLIRQTLETRYDE